MDNKVAWRLHQPHQDLSGVVGVEVGKNCGWKTCPGDRKSAYNYCQVLHTTYGFELCFASTIPGVGQRGFSLFHSEERANSDLPRDLFLLLIFQWEILSLFYHISSTEFQ